MARLRMLGHIHQRLLRHAIESRPGSAIELFDPGKRDKGDTNACLLQEAIHVRLQGRDQAQIIQHSRAQIACEAMNDLNGLHHEALRDGDLLMELTGIGTGLRLQSRKP